MSIIIVLLSYALIVAIAVAPIIITHNSGMDFVLFRGRISARLWRLTTKKSMTDAPRGYLLWAIQNGNRHMRYLAWEEVARRVPFWNARYTHWFFEWSNCISKEFDAEVSQKRYDAWTVVWAIDRQNDEKRWAEKRERKSLHGTPREKEDYSE